MYNILNSHVIFIFHLLKRSGRSALVMTDDQSVSLLDKPNICDKYRRSMNVGDDEKIGIADEIERVRDGERKRETDKGVFVKELEENSIKQRHNRVSEKYTEHTKTHTEYILICCLGAMRGQRKCTKGEFY